MPTPLEVLLDPISLGLLAMYCGLFLIEHLFPGKKLQRPKAWYLKCTIALISYFYLASYLPLIWDNYLASYQLFDLTQSNAWLSAFAALFIFELLIYIWHRAMHEFNWLWRIFHQMHHSAEVVDSIGAFYFSPLDMIGFTLLGSISLVVVVGVSPEAATYFLFISQFLAVFQHSNIKTPYWLGYVIQRPESHRVHHGKGIHQYNYSDLPIFDIVFGTFRNPKTDDQETGFYNGASNRVVEMLYFKDIYTRK